MWNVAIPLIAAALGGLFGRHKSGGSSGGSDQSMQMLQQIMQRQQQRSQQNDPLRQMLLGEAAGQMPTYLKRGPQYQQWLHGAAPGASTAMLGGGMPPSMTYDPRRTM